MQDMQVTWIGVILIKWLAGIDLGTDAFVCLFGKYGKKKYLLAFFRILIY